MSLKVVLAVVNGDIWILFCCHGFWIQLEFEFGLHGLNLAISRMR